MSKWAPANEYVPVTKGSTAVITLQSDGDVYGYMDASTTGVLLASASAGVTKVPTGSFSKITCTAPFILTTESAMSRFRGGEGGTSGGGGSTVNDWITVNDAGEAVLNFPDEANPLIENIKLSHSTFTKVTGTTGCKQNCASLFQQNTKLQEVVLNLPSANTLYSIFGDCTKIEKIILTADNALDVGYLVTKSKIETADFYFPKATAAEGMLFDNNILTQANIKLPAAKNCGWLINNSPMFVTFTFHLGEMQTLDLTQEGHTTKLGNLTALQNVTVLEGGLASCTSFIITNSTSLTNESIQNIIDALPDYSGTETSALVSFPPDRLTTEQQEQLTSKGWTYDAATTISTFSMTSYWFFTSDNSGDFIDANGKRYIAHRGSAFHTPQGLNVGCPEAETAEEAGAVMGLTYEPLPKEEDEQTTIE